MLAIRNTLQASLGGTELMWDVALGVVLGGGFLFALGFFLMVLIARASA